MVRLISRKTSTFHDFPYAAPERKCFHCWIVNVTPPGPSHCVHQCVYCYARESIYTDYGPEPLVYNNLAELVEKDLRKLQLCPPVLISNVSDPCQDVPEVRAEVVRLVQVLLCYGVSFAITTKGDASFLLDIPGLAAYKRKFIAVTIEGTGEMLELLSPGAPSYRKRLDSVRRLTDAGVGVIIRLDPAFPHLLEALYDTDWLGKIEGIVAEFAAAGARHVVSSTGRLSKRTGVGGAGSWQKVYDTIRAVSVPLAHRFEADYTYESSWAGRGWLLRRDIRLVFHQRVCAMAEAHGMTYGVCQELTASDSDSPRIPHCEGIALPFVVKDGDGRFRPVTGCTAMCHVSCRGKVNPPCARPELATASPLRMTLLR